MPVPGSGAISLNQFHVEAGGSSGTQCSINDSDIRGLIGKSSGVQMSFNEWYGASASQAFTTIKAGYSFFTFTGGRGSTRYGFNAGFDADGSAPTGSISYTDDLVVGGTNIGNLTRASVDNVAASRHDFTFKLQGSNSNSGFTNVICTRISNNNFTAFARTSFTYSYSGTTKTYLGPTTFNSTGNLTAGGTGYLMHCKFWGDDTPSYSSTGTDTTFTGKIEFS